MSAIIPIETVIKKLSDAHGDVVSIIPETYKAVGKKATFVDKDYGIWDAVVKSVLKGCGNPKRHYASARANISYVIEKIKHVHGDRVKIIENTYSQSNKKATFVDKDYGIWEARVIQVLRGSGHPKRASENHRICLDAIKNKIRQIHGDVITIVENSYKKVTSKATFIDKQYGEFKSLVNSVLHGCGHPKRGVSKILKKHWNTNEELLCVSSYEIKVVEFLNKNRINFEWQSKTFEIPTECLVTPKGNPTTYRPDLFLAEENKWIEIKGYFRKDALQKWQWFQSEYPNSELWDKIKLKEMGIL